MNLYCRLSGGLFIFKLEINPDYKDRTRNYNTSPGELYANFHELRLHLGMKPGEQWDSEKLNKRLEERGEYHQQDFINDFPDSEYLDEAYSYLVNAFLTHK